MEGLIFRILQYFKLDRKERSPNKDLRLHLGIALETSCSEGIVH